MSELTRQGEAFLIRTRSRRPEDRLAFIAGLGLGGEDQGGITLYEFGIHEQERERYEDMITRSRAQVDAADARTVVDVAYITGRAQLEEDWARDRVKAQIGVVIQELAESRTIEYQ